MSDVMSDECSNHEVTFEFNYNTFYFYWHANENGTIWYHLSIKMHHYIYTDYEMS